ncbi:predicted protein, partial [Arabidopsis lyrata subsp. lyrata]
KRIPGLFVINRVFMNGNRLHESSVFSRVWDPGEILCELVQLGWLDHYFGENKKQKLLPRNYEIVILEITIIAKVIGVLSLERLSHGEKVQALAIQDGTLHFSSGLDNHNFSSFMKLLLGWNQTFLITHHGLEIKGLSWFKELYEKDSLPEILLIEVAGCSPEDADKSGLAPK